MGNLPYISSEQGVLIIRTELIYELPYISVLYLYENLELKRGWAYNTYYTVVTGTALYTLYKSLTTAWRYCYLDIRTGCTC